MKSRFSLLLCFFLGLSAFIALGVCASSQSYAQPGEKTFSDDRIQENQNQKRIIKKKIIIKKKSVTSQQSTEPDVKLPDNVNIEQLPEDVQQLLKSSAGGAGSADNADATVQASSVDDGMTDKEREEMFDDMSPSEIEDYTEAKVCEGICLSVSWDNTCLKTCKKSGPCGLGFLDCTSGNEVSIKDGAFIEVPATGPTEFTVGVRKDGDLQ